jgi:lipoprotein-anchoring transpeptidase ErfK/SrfK
MFICPYQDCQRSFRVQYSITINLSDRRLYLIQNKEIFKSYPVAIGKPATPTPKGTFQIVNVAVNPGGPFGVRWLGLDAPYGDYGIHGTNDPSSIGKAISNGCVRMYNEGILDLVKYVWVGTIVKIV